MEEVSEGKRYSHQQDDPTHQTEEVSLVSCSTNGEDIPAKDTEGEYWLHQVEEHLLHQVEEQHHQMDEVSLMTATNGEDTVAEGSDEATMEELEKDRENELNESEDTKQDTKEGEDEKKKKNRLEAVGSWFQGLVGGGATQQELRQRTNKDQKEDDVKDIENPEPLEETENHSSSDETPVDEFEEEFVDENMKKKGGLRQQISTFFGTKQRRVLLFAFAILVFAVCILAPVLYVVCVKIVSLLRNAETAEPSLLAQMMKHPLYQGELEPYGHITFRFDQEGLFLVNFRLEGLEERCNRCSWKIVEGGTCQDAKRLGDTGFYDQKDPAFINFNPYVNTFYETRGGLSETARTVYTGYSLEKTQGHAIVLSDSNRQPLVCGVLKMQAHPMALPKLSKLWANLKNLPGYPESHGKVRLDFYADRAFKLSFDFTGVPPKCLMCNINIHAGTSCTGPPGDYLWNTEKLKHDPWGPVNGAYYKSDANGTSVRRHGFYFFDGFGYDDHVNHVVVLQDAAGMPVACGELKESSQEYVWTETQDAVRVTMESGSMVDAGPMSAVGAGPMSGAQFATGVETINLVENDINDN